jgi:hypothetical protein
MTLKAGKPNPLNYFGLRRVEFACPHFKYTSLEKFNPSLTKELDYWVKHNLNGRYYIGQDLALDHTNTIVYITKIGFEIEKELSFFKIACPLVLMR